MEKEKIQNLISQMTLEEKAGMCSGADFWHLKGIERLGIPSVMVTDGPHGLRKQAQGADQVLYHLDGPQAIRHLDALMEIKEIDALQWTSGDAGPDGTLEEWDAIYDKARAAGKSLWVKVYSGEFEDWLRNVDRIVQKYGSHSLFLMFPEMSMEQAERLLEYADKNWSDVEGTFRA